MWKEGTVVKDVAMIKKIRNMKKMEMRKGKQIKGNEAKCR